MRALTLLIPGAVLATLALVTHELAFKLAVPGWCMVVLVAVGAGGRPPRAHPWPVIAALACSMVGDAFLSTRGDSVPRFVAGIAAYLVAHLGYLTFALRNGRLAWPVLGVLLVGFVPYYVAALKPAIGDPVLGAAVLFYLVISCVSLAAVAGLDTVWAKRWCFVVGISLLVFSDTLISFSEFLGYRALNPLILPTYYLALLGVTLAMVGWPEPGGRGSTA